jgi:hypothetical protein|tara:strand:- start:238 stop:435 length:198 start_codon:yes stop_codon:yes gene_type:complete
MNIDKKQLTDELQFVCRDYHDTCAKYVKLAKENNKVEIQVLYRFSKPSNYLEDKNKFLKEHKLWN